MKMSVMSIPRSMISATGSRGILQLRCGKVTVSYRKAPEIIGKIRKISGRNTASRKSPELPRTVSCWAGLFDLGCEDNFINHLNNQNTTAAKIKSPDT
jgi:hypothetical protein